MHIRSPELQEMLDALEAAVLAGAPSMPSALPTAWTVFAALRDRRGAPALPARQRAVIYESMIDCLATARRASLATRRLAEALATLEPQLAWRPRSANPDDPPEFRNAHANAVLIGEGGLEERTDVRIGISLVAANTTYPHHRHPPEEFYVVLSPGSWRQDEEEWLERAPGQLVHNPPGIWHSMQAGEVPLLAVWCLWHGD